MAMWIYVFLNILLCTVVAINGHQSPYRPQWVSGPKMLRRRRNTTYSSENLPQLSLQEGIGDEEFTAANYNNYGVDISTRASSGAFACMRNGGYSTVFTRIYEPSGNGLVDLNGFDTIRKASDASMGIEIYIEPSTQGTKSASHQFGEVLVALKKDDINVNRIWLKVTKPIDWPCNPGSNRQLITDFMRVAKQNNVGFGIYTNWYDWQQITDNWTGWNQFGPVALWYWNANGYGYTSQSQPTTDDFSEFAGFTVSAVKNYALKINLCGVIVNANFYKVSRAKVFVARPPANGISVGIIGLPINSVTSFPEADRSQS